MKRILLAAMLLLFVCNGACAQYFENVLERYAAEKKADVVDVPQSMMKVARLFVSGRERQLFKMIESMSILSLKDCGKDVKERFLEEMRECEPQGYESALHVGKKGITSRVFAKKSNEDGVAYEMVVASVENRGDVALMIMNGKFNLAEVVEIFK